MTATQQAIVVLEKGGAGIRGTPIPKPRDEWVLVRVTAIALNPTDWKHIDFKAADPGSRCGCDYAGVVEEVGSKVVKFQKGDRIAGVVHGGDSTDHDNGAFGEYLVAKAAVQMRIPDNLSDVEAATLGVSTMTVGQGLYKSLRLPLPTTPAKTAFPILIYAASTACGIAGIQYAKASGLTVIATASPHNFAYLKSLGADEVFDYRSPTCAADIKAFTNNSLTHAWDCTSTGTRICAEAMSDSSPGVYGVINPVDADGVKELKAANPHVEGPRFTLAYEVMGEPVRFLGREFPAKAEELEFAASFAEMSERLYMEGAVKPIRTVVNKTGAGLDGALAGLEELRMGRVSGEKLIYTVG